MALLLACGVMHLVRLVRWTGYRTFADRLVLILHVAYAFIPAGFFLTALSALRSRCAECRDPRLDRWRDRHHDARVMSRATLGHTGQPLEASPATHLIYARSSSRRWRGSAPCWSPTTPERCWRLQALPGPRRFLDLPRPIRWRSGRRVGSDLQGIRFDPAGRRRLACRRLTAAAHEQPDGDARSRTAKILPAISRRCGAARNVCSPPASTTISP